MKGARKNEQNECIGLLNPTHLTLNGGLKYGFAAEVLLILTTILPKYQTHRVEDTIRIYSKIVVMISLCVILRNYK